ncbi:1-acyl-sn-glycerol-3-phosphate acyltransferase [Candidatus Pelagibacter sp.]|nr:1-acyl-sn-glycerol-3-phosphate acyltransferase [Candidatus Pelagibacter sp.]
MIRNIFFSIFFFIGIVLISIIFLPALILPGQITLFGGKLMGHWTKLCLENILSAKIIIKGKENIIQDKKFFIASSHQSMFETFFLQIIFNSPIFILKKELLSIPIFGWYLKKIDSISINRNKIAKENIGFFETISNTLEKTNRPLIIFPQATRVLPTERPPFKKGVARIYDQLKIDCQPVAINSGYVWPKKGFKTSNKNIVVSILKPIESGLSKEDFIRTLEKNIYLELDLID